MQRLILQLQLHARLETYSLLSLEGRPVVYDRRSPGTDRRLTGHSGPGYLLCGASP